MTRDRARKKAIRARMTTSGEPYSVAARKHDSPVLRDVITRADNTMAARSARIEYRRDLDVIGQRPVRRQPGPVGRLVASTAKAAWRRIAPGTDFADMRDVFMHQVGEGFVEPAAGRSLVDYGSYAQVYVDGQHFGGRSGRPLGPRFRDRPEPPHHPVSLLRLLQDATDARPAGQDVLRGTPCRKIAVRAGSTDLMVWIDQDHIRQIQFKERSSDEEPALSRTQTLELWDFGVPVDSLDWTRLPTFRTPAE